MKEYQEPTGEVVVAKVRMQLHERLYLECRSAIPRDQSFGNREVVVQRMCRAMADVARQKGLSLGEFRSEFVVGKAEAWARVYPLAREAIYRLARVQ